MSRCRVALVLLALGALAVTASCSTPGRSAPGATSGTSDPRLSRGSAAPVIQGTTPSTVPRVAGSAMGNGAAFCNKITSLNTMQAADRDAILAAVKALEEVKQDAPADVAAQIEVIITVSRKIADTAPDDVQGATSLMFEPEVMQAFADLGTYVKSTCGLELK